MESKKYLSIISHMESRLEKYGDSPLGVGWPKKEDVDTRYKVMLEIVNVGRSKKVRLLDFGCGASHLYEFIIRNKLSNIDYSGLDISQKFIDLSKSKFPFIKYYCIDILSENDDVIPNFDYIVMNGVFTEKRELSFDEMFFYFKEVVKKVFRKARIGIAFNVMSKHVDWEREDLFHLPFDMLCSFLTREISRNYTIRNDYGLYEYTIYIYQ